MSRNKRYNPNKLIRLRTDRIMDSHAVCFMSGEDNCFMLNLDTYRTTEALDPELARVIMDNRHNWRVHIFALCVGYDGVPYMKQDEVCVSDSVRHSELLPYLNDAHAVLCAECNVRDLVRPAWMAYAGGRELHIGAELLRVFEERGGFDR